MGDFLIDFRPREKRELSAAAKALKFYDDMRVETWSEDDFGLVFTSTDDAGLWGSYRSPEGVTVVLNGRVALEEKEWEQARQLPGNGGLAAKAIYQVYRGSGVKAVGNISGNFVILIHDAAQKTLAIITDAWGCFPCFGLTQGSASPMYSSHPDVLADAAGESKRWDLTSFGEFVITGKISFPYTNYEAVRSVANATVLTINLAGRTPGEIKSREHHFEFKFSPIQDSEEADLAQELAEGFRTSMRKRTLPLLGKSAVALSGGLDSRTVLCAAPEPKRILTFSCYDQENLEFSIARNIAQTAGAEFIPMRRDFDHYANSADLGTRISGGMGCIGSNHFLGFRDQFKQLGVQNFLTGCYCDYIFKALAFNRETNRITLDEKVGAFNQRYYADHFWFETELAQRVRERLDNLFPEEWRRDRSEAGLQRVEQRRIFPLSYEADNAERIITQRVMGWYPPIAELSLLKVYLKMPSRLKLNRRLFVQAVPLVCGEAISRIPDANTGLSVGANPLLEAVSCHVLKFRRRLGKLRKSVITTSSWPNWSAYIVQSTKLREQWMRPNPAAREVFEKIVGKNRFTTDIKTFYGAEMSMWLQLYSLKLWLDQRA